MSSAEPETVAAAVLEAIEHRDEERLRLLLHPYLHWTGPDGVTVRGRRRVLARLAVGPVPDRPAAIELRDGQVYRWTTVRSR